MDWTEEQTSELVRLVAEYGPTEIAKKMGLTKNQIIGKLHRLGYGGSRNKPAMDRKARIEYLSALLPAPRECQYAEGDRPPYKFCGRPTAKRIDQHGDEVDSPWCAEHMAICYVRGPSATQRMWDSLTPEQRAARIAAIRRGKLAAAGKDDKR